MMRFISIRGLFVFLGLFSMVIAGSVFLARSQSAQDTEPPRGTGRFSKPDRITEAIRDANNDFVSISVRNEADRESAKTSGSVIADYGTEIVVARRKDSPDAITGLDERALDTRINLPGKRFEPSEITAAKESTAVSTGKDYYIVQFGAHVKDDWLDAVRDLGAEIIQYVPNQAFIVYADAEAAQSLSDHSRVRWTGRYLPEHKVSELGKGRAESFGAAQTEFHVAVFKRSDLSSVYRDISSVPGLEILEVQEPGFGFIDLFTVRVSGDAVNRLAGINDVFRVDPYEQPVAEDERAAQIVAGNYTSTTTIAGPGYDPLAQFGVDGTGVTVSISDDGVGIPGNGGFYITPANAVDGPLRGATAGAEGGHGHINASIVAGSTPFGGLDPTSYNYGRGVAPGAHIINIPFLKTGNTTTDAQSVDDTVNTAGPNGVKGSIINNSWGAGTNGNTYDSFAALWDGFVFDASFAGTTDPITVVFSAGNSGVSGLTRPKMAKNVITVANSENLRTELGGSNADNIDDMRSSSSRGPAADGRVKPDISAPGTYIAGSRSGGLGGVWGAIDANHVYSGGTSHSAPQIAGVAALFTQFWKNNNGGQNPSPSLVKAAILNSGLEMTGFGSNTPLPNGDEGWGRVNMKLIFDSGTTTIFQNETTQMFEPGFANVLEGTVANSSKPVRIALVWTDPPGSTDPALVNDLDLTVTVGGNVYKGNVFNAGTSETGGTADNKNNVEMVRLPAGVSAGTPVSIEIKAIALNGDGIPGNGDLTDQTFSLVAYNLNSSVPIMVNSSASPSKLPPGTQTLITADVTPGTEPNSSGLSVIGDLSNIGGAADQVLYDDGTNGDKTPGDNVFSFLTTIPINTSVGTKSIVLNASDAEGRSTDSGLIITITPPCSVMLNPSSSKIGPGGGDLSFAIDTSEECEWYAGSDESWASIVSPSAGTGDGTIELSIETNIDRSRESTITVNDKHFTLIQGTNCTYKLVPNEFSLQAVGGMHTFSVNTNSQNCSWEVFSDSEWIGIQGDGSGQGNGSVSFVVAPNVGPSRSGSLSVESQIVSVTQLSGCEYSINPMGTTISALGGPTGFSVSSGSGCGWEAVSNESWIGIVGSPSGSGKGEVLLDVSVNSGPARSGTVSLGGQTFTVDQENGCTFHLNPTSSNVPSGAGSSSFQISTNSGCEWSVESNDDWLSLTGPTSGSGSSSITFQYAENSFEERTGTIASGGELFTVVQASGCMFTLSSESANLPAEGGQGSFSVNTFPQCGWGSVSNDNWIVVTGGSTGSGSGNVLFEVEANVGPTRSGTITSAGHTYTVNQDSGCSYSFSVYETTFPAAGGVGGFNVSTVEGCSWSAESSSDWISITSGSGTGSGVVSFSVSKNLGLQRVTDIAVGSTVFTVIQLAATGGGGAYDFDGDGATDVSVFRPNSQPTAQWWLLRSSDSGTRGLAFGSSTDVPVAADFTGDGKTDVAFWRPSTGEWFILRSEDDSFFAFPFGANGDIPAPGDFDGDGKADPAVYRPSSGTWFIVRSSDGGLSVVPFGVAVDQPIVADYDGDGKDDVGVYRAPDNQFWLLRSTDGVKAFQFGAPGDRTAVGDWTGDGKADVAFFRPSTSEWYVIRSEDDSFFAFPWGATGDIPSPGDFDGDGKFDPAVWRPSDRTWYIFGTTSGFEAVQFGSNGDVPLPSSVSVN